jgi:homoserine dehydrogenase
VVIKGLFYDKQFMFGRGAGGHPTGSAVLSDITACLYDYKYEYKKRHNSDTPKYDDNIYFRVYFRYTETFDLEVVKFREIYESYESKDYKYVVGDLSLHSLLKAQEELRRRNIFVAAYPRD